MNVYHSLPTWPSRRFLGSGDIGYSSLRSLASDNQIGIISVSFPIPNNISKEPCPDALYVANSRKTAIQDTILILGIRIDLVGPGG